MKRSLCYGVWGGVAVLLFSCPNGVAGEAETPVSLEDLQRGKVPLLRALAVLNVDDPPFERTFPELLKKNPKWKDEAVVLLRAWITNPATFDEREREWSVLMQGFRDEAHVAGLVSKILRDAKVDRALRRQLLQVMARMQAPPSDEWLGDLAVLLNDDGLRRDVLAIVKKNGLRDFDRSILAMITKTELPVELRIAAIDAIAARLTVTPEMFALLMRELQKNADPVARLVAGRAVASVRLSEAQALELAAVLSKLSASMGMLALPAFSRQRNEEVGLAVVRSLRGSATAKRMTLADLDRLLASYSNDVLRESRGLRDDIVRQAPEGEAEAFAKIARELPLGDARRGQEVFKNARTACASCHRAAGHGGGIGPNLSRVGFLHSPNELLESIVLPSASQVAEFRSWRVTTDRGRNFAGFIVAETAETLYVREADRTLRRIARATIDDVEMSRLSLMPEGLDKLLTRQQLADLIQFLTELR